MLLSSTADHALRAVLFLARQEPERLSTADEIAAAIGAPRNYLSKTLHLLAKAGVIQSTAGRKGGFSLAIPARRLTLHRVVSVFDEPAKSSRCLLGNRPCTMNRPCTAHDRWIEISRAHDVALKSTVIADLIEE